MRGRVRSHKPRRGQCCMGSAKNDAAVPSLTQDNRNLKEQNDELNGQIINLSIQGAKNLFSTSFSESLAAEISSVSRDEVRPVQARRPDAPQSVHRPGTDHCSSHSSWTQFRSRRR